MPLDTPIYRHHRLSSLIIHHERVGTQIHIDMCRPSQVTHHANLPLCTPPHTHTHPRAGHVSSYSACKPPPLLPTLRVSVSKTAQQQAWQIGAVHTHIHTHAGRSSRGDMHASPSAPHLAGLSDEDCTAASVADEVLCRCAFEDIFVDSKFLRQGELKINVSALKMSDETADLGKNLTLHVFYRLLSSQEHARITLSTPFSTAPF